MKISDLDQPRIGDIVEFETDPDTVVEGLIVGETEDGYIYEFSDSGYTALNESVEQGVTEGSDLPIHVHKSPYEGSDDEHRYTTAFPASPNSAQRFAKHIISKGGKAKIGKRSQDYYVYHNILMSKEDWRKSEQQGVAEEKQRLDPKCWDGYKKQGTKMKGGTRVNNCVPESAGYIARNAKEAQDPRFSTSMTVDVGTDTMRKQLDAFFPTTAPSDGQQQVTEAQYQGREVPLGRPMRGDVKKFKVYVKDPKTGNVKKVNFGDPNMRIKKSNPARRKSFRARHNCSTPGPRDKARYWSCRKW